MRQVTPQPIVSDIRTTQILKELCEASNQAAQGILWPHVSVTAAYTSGIADLVIYVTPGGAMTVTIPAAKDMLQKVLIVKRKDGSAHAITVAAASGNIDGAANKALGTSGYDVMRLHSDGSNYYTV